ncbi:hypothetical protein PHSY_002081 [Pseudozyma hubeiensis SY62]|uniref:Uncharacterized protein n=1 Tax=Pseudozyma hubeiensis (strain SY62) TaxID=1305764 RepID=R9P0A1_PSEHS|nr:hypothetical protein PHSY_002081 [Pseudozyma hubeiensis SY62]GAC94509.1 hypothetical protein PHSY_002081 [Pseudozyma hubeiensis SY62]
MLIILDTFRRRRINMRVIKPNTMFRILLLVVISVVHCQASRPKKVIAFDSSPVQKRNLGGKLKDWYLINHTKNYFCTDTGRLVPVDPHTGHMLLKGLRRRDNWFDDLVGHSHATERGICRNPTWVLPQGWTQPIPVTQFNAQYPWMTVDDRGQIRLRDDFRSWLEQRQAAGAQMTAPAAGGGAGGGAGAGALPDGGAGYIPPSAMTFAPGTGTASGLGQNSFGNGVTAGSAAHI